MVKMELRNVFGLIDVIIFTVLLQSVENRSIFKFTGVSCESLDKTFGAFTLCEIKAISRDVNELSSHYTVYKKPFEDITFNMTLKRRGMEHIKPMLEFSIDACAFLRNKRRNPLADLFYTVSGLGVYSNMNHTCPFDHDIIIDSYQFNASHVDLVPVPSGYYSLLVEVAIEKIPRVVFNAFFQFLRN